MVQIGTSRARRSGGATAATVYLSEVEDGVHVRMGEQQWLGLAASFTQTALMTLLRPTSIIGRLDDVAQDISSLTLADRIMDTLKDTAATLGASYKITQRLRRLTCPYCGTANPVGDPSCVACGGPLGYRQPIACNNCGFVSEAGTEFCPNCGEPCPYKVPDLARSTCPDQLPAGSKTSRTHPDSQHTLSSAAPCSGL